MGQESLEKYLSNGVVFFEMLLLFTLPNADKFKQLQLVKRHGMSE